MSTLEIQTRRVRNETVDEITRLEKAIQRCQSTIQRLRVTKAGFNPRVVIERNEAQIREFETEKATLERKLETIDNGRYGEILQAEMDHNRQVIEQKAAQTKKRRAADVPAKPAAFAKPHSNNHNRGGFHKPSYSTDTSEREFSYGEKSFYRDVSSLPDHLYDKLQNMPSNMGYIWRDIWFFGHKSPDRSGEYSLFEKRGNRMLVHVLNRQARTVTLYEKDNTGRRKFIERTPMRPDTGSVNIAQLVRDA